MAGGDPVVIGDKSAMRAWSRYRRQAGATIALVPTMGYLHEGHFSLVRTARSAADLVVVSIYVNPGQFSPSEDLASYPSDLPADLRNLSFTRAVDAVFCPRNLYDYGGGVAEEGTISGGEAACCADDSGHESWVRVERLEKGLCGRSRPAFLRGVATVVTKLFNIVEPDVAVLGKKDYQQWRLVCRMVRDLDFPIKIIGSELIREADGLAMSSRNIHLSPEDRKKALSISRSLSNVKSAAQSGQISCKELSDLVVTAVTEAGGRIDYVEIVEQESLNPLKEITSPAVVCVAAFFGKVRLIDNMEISL